VLELVYMPFCKVTTAKLQIIDVVQSPDVHLQIKVFLARPRLDAAHLQGMLPAGGRREWRRTPGRNGTGYGAIWMHHTPPDSQRQVRGIRDDRPGRPHCRQHSTQQWVISTHLASRVLDR
jgi:hypothetical protein